MVSLLSSLTRGYSLDGRPGQEKDDPCKDLLEADISDGLGSIAALFLVWPRALKKYGCVVVILSFR